MHKVFHTINAELGYDPRRRSITYKKGMSNELDLDDEQFLKMMSQKIYDNFQETLIK